MFDLGLLGFNASNKSPLDDCEGNIPRAPSRGQWVARSARVWRNAMRITFWRPVTFTARSEACSRPLALRPSLTRPWQPTLDAVEACEDAFFQRSARRYHLCHLPHLYRLIHIHIPPRHSC